ncbi:hypothetical protein O181_009309 [Austropuccinia psidii MF-1]|uniref:Reverse transcriptase domain-containing protein n=1 Tax=Austropuccinia psidii MF-1 TaxID=1389203 RepID=A0A9Q3BQL0_9BASI|nr:hypothetical protein [Austropuccinia psidii MF-1]
MKSLERGLPRGSPLSFPLKLIYESELKGADTDRTKSNCLSIGYINDFTHLVAADTTLEAMREMESLSGKTIEWGRKMGSEFNKKNHVIHWLRKRTGATRIRRGTPESK